MNILGGLDRPSAGRVSVDGNDLLKLSYEGINQYRRTKIGFVWQQGARNLIPYLTALENVRLPVTIRAQSWSEERPRLEALLEAVGLGERKHHRLSELSGGEQQRVAIARALAMHPALLLLDEPTSALDPRRIHSLRALLRTFVDRGHTMIIISHSMGFLAGVSDNILFMEGGVAVEYGRADEVLKSPKDPRTKDFLEQAE